MLKEGLVSREVAGWQQFLGIEADGIFGAETTTATKSWQQANGLEPDGIVGESTVARAIEKGFAAPKRIAGETNYYPPRPSFGSPNNSQREKLFGKFSWQRKSGNSSDIEITSRSWISENIVRIQVRQLIGIEGAPRDGVITVHRLAAEPIQGFFEEVERQGLLDLILTWGGSFYPRFIRGSQSTLSNHSWGTAFDINAAWNWLGDKPAAVGKKGSLLKLVVIANSFGFYWGGHYTGRLDGMHFELAALGKHPSQTIPVISEDDDILEFLPEKTTEAPGKIFELPPFMETIAAPINQTVNNAAEQFENVSERMSETVEEAAAVGGKISESTTERIQNGAKEIEKTITETKDRFNPLDIPAFLPRFGKKWLWSLIPGGSFITTIAAYIQDAPQWLVFLLGFITGVTAYAFFQLLIKHSEMVLKIIQDCYRTIADPTQHNLIPTDAAKELGTSLFGSLIGSRRDALQKALTPKPVQEPKTASAT